MRGKLKIRHVLLIACLSAVWATQLLPGWGDAYAQSVYPAVSRLLSSFSRLLPFAVGDLFIFLSIAGLLLYPFYARRHRGKKWKYILLDEAKYQIGRASCRERVSYLV